MLGAYGHLAHKQYEGILFVSVFYILKKWSPVTLIVLDLAAMLFTPKTPAMNRFLPFCHLICVRPWSEISCKSRCLCVHCAAKSSLVSRFVRARV